MSTRFVPDHDTAQSSPTRRALISALAAARVWGRLPGRVQGAVCHCPTDRAPSTTTYRSRGHDYDACKTHLVSVALLTVQVLLLAWTYLAELRGGPLLAVKVASVALVAWILRNAWHLRSHKRPERVDSSL